MLKSLLCAALLLAGGSAWAAQVVGVVAHSSGPLLDRKLDGSVKVLGPKSEVENGDTLVSEKNTYAQIRFVDNSEITLKPGTTFRIENFSYDAGKPEADSAAFNLVKGGLRSITGLLGKRNKEKYSLKTPSATIGIRGTTFIAQYVPPQGKVVIDRSPQGDGGGPAGVPLSSAQEQALLNTITSQAQAAMQQAPGQASAPQAAAASPSRELQGLVPGLHLQVTDGMIVVTNPGGAQNIAAGQFGFVPGLSQAPVIVPPNTGLQFAPPPSFSGNATGPQASTGGALPDKPGVDCVVR